MSDVTHLLEAIEHGDPKAAEDLLPLVYEELRRSFSRTTRRLPPRCFADTMRT